VNTACKKYKSVIDVLFFNSLRFKFKIFNHQQRFFKIVGYINLFNSNFKKMCFFIKIQEIKRETCFAGLKCYYLPRNN